MGKIKYPVGIQSFSKIRNGEYVYVDKTELIHRLVMYVIMKLMGFYAHTEYRTSNGLIDMLVETEDYIYVMEFKIDSTADDALRQIDEKDYPLPFRKSGKTIFKIGANFDTGSRRLSDWTFAKV